MHLRKEALNPCISFVDFSIPPEFLSKLKWSEDYCPPYTVRPPNHGVTESLVSIIVEPTIGPSSFELGTSSRWFSNRRELRRPPFDPTIRRSYCNYFSSKLLELKQ